MKIDHKEPRLRKVGNHFTLMPGVNQVDEKEFQAAMKLPAFKALVDDGIIEVLDAGETDDLSTLNTKAAVALVGKTTDRELLGTWAKAEKRADVKAAIAKQLEAVKPEPKSDDKK